MGCHFKNSSKQTQPGKNSRLDYVLPAEHVVDALEIVDALGNSVRAAGGGIALLQVGFLAQLAHLDWISAGSI